MTAALEPVLTLARQTGAHVLAVHHLGKGERADGDAILGSTAILAAADTALILKRSERHRTLSTIQRYGEDLEEITLSLDAETRWITPGPSRTEADETDAARAILEYLAGQAAPVDESTIHEAMEWRRGVKVRALRRLVSEGRASRAGSGKKGDPYRYGAVSGLLVPHLCREPENQNPQKDVSGRQDAEHSSTRQPGQLRQGPGSRELGPTSASEALRS